MKKILVIGLFLAVLAGVGLWVFSPKTEEAPIQSGEASVALTAEGFTPQELRIRQGTIVTFTTETGKFFWPASDLHPSHGIYPAFDPKKPIEATASWSFTFDEEGAWEYHDHLSPYYTGTITVVP